MSEAWPLVRLEELATKVGSGEASYAETGVPLIRSMNVVFFGFKREGMAYLDERQAVELKNVEVRSGDVLLNITGASIGRVTIAPSDMDGARVNQHVCIIRPLDGLDSRYLRAFLSSPTMQDAIRAENYGVTRQALTKQQILDFQIPLAPLNEQKRIADKLDTVLARVDACRERLNRLSAILKRFRQAVLAAATSGALTEDWYTLNIAAMPRYGSTRYRLRKLADLVREPMRNGKSVRDGDGLRVLRLSALKGGKIDWAETKRGAWGAIDGSRFLIKEGDFLVARGNGSRDLVGRGALVVGNPPAVAFPNTIIRIRSNNAIILPNFLRIIWDTQQIRDQIEFAARTTAGIWKIAQTDLEDIEIPVPLVDEQHEVVRRVEALFAYADRLEARYTAAHIQVERLTPALLAKAFHGELVSQDPDDEPASVLLERIRTARAEQPTAKRGRKPPTARMSRAPREKAAMTKSRYDDDVREKTDAEQAQLMQLARELNELSVSRTHPNLYFEHFTNALARRLGAGPEVTLSKEEIEAQARLADEVLEEVITEEEAGGTGEPA